jgi:UDP-N-acetylmuramate--alanine ligase
MTAPTARLLRPGARVHLVGIGGAGMSALAQLLLERGVTVSGSDLRGGLAAQAVAALGARVHVGHDAAHVGGAELVAVSNAIPGDNPEVVRARERGIPVLLRAELLELLMRDHRRILVTGTHGKTTTTAMVTVALQAAGLDPSFAIGGAVHDAGTSAHHGAGGVFVAEADEAYRSFLHLTGDCVVVTNVEMDHHDVYDSEAAVAEAFERFVGRASGAGPAVLCRDDPGATQLAAAAPGAVLTYGEHVDADLRITAHTPAPGGSAFRLTEGSADLGTFHLRVLGRHNVRNATAAVAAARWAGADLDAVRSGLAAFSGAQRRFQRIGEAGGVAVVDDYAHHPTEVAAVLDAARQAHPAGRVVAVFQPHLYSRTRAFAPALGQALAAADVVIVTDVYGARETPVPGVTGGLVVDSARARGAEVHYVPGTGDVPDTVAGLARPGDLVLTLGAGDITEAGPVILRRLEGSR